MAEVRWLIQAQLTEQKVAIITAPDAPAGVDAAVERLKDALDGFAGRKPAWFKVLQRLGYWWYPICMAATAVVFVRFATNGEGIGVNIAYGLGFGVGIAVATGGILWCLAYLQSRLLSGSSVEETKKEVAPLARLAGSIADRVEAILAWDPAREREVHLLAWQAAEVGRPDREAVFRELAELWKQADPVAAAEQEARFRELESKVAELKRKGKP